LNSFSPAGGVLWVNLRPAGLPCADIAKSTVGQYEFEYAEPWHYEGSDRMEGNFDICAQA
jgi:hypothetical protein